MKKSYPLWWFVLMLLPSVGVAQNWQRTYTDTAFWSYGFAYDVKPTFDGGYVLGGEIDLPTGAIRHYIQIIKTDANGIEQWRRAYTPFDIQLDRFGALLPLHNGFLIAGTTSLSSATTGAEVHLMRTDLLGDTLWTRIFGTPNVDDYCIGGLLTTDGSIVTLSQNGQNYTLFQHDTTGQFLNATSLPPIANLSIFDFQPSPDGNFIATGTHNGQLLIAKINLMADTIWTRTYQFSTGDAGSAIRPTADGGWVVVGEASGFAGTNPMIARLDSIGNLMWWQTLGAVNLLNTAATSVAVRPDGAFAVVGTLHRNSDFFSTLNQGFLAIFDSGGNLLTLDSLYHGQNCDASSVWSLLDGSLVIGGRHLGSFYMEKRGSTTHTSPIQSPDLKIYPNPFAKYLFIEPDRPIEPEKMEATLFDPSGRVVVRQTLHFPFVFQRQSLPQGVYILYLSSETGWHFSKVVSILD